MAESVMRSLVADAGLAEAVVIDSAGTGDWHIGERSDHRTLIALSQAGYDGSDHRARQFEPSWFGHRELVIALDRGHERTLRSWASSEADRAKVTLLRRFDPSADAADLDVADPYYDGPVAFNEVLDQIESACDGLLQHVQAALAGAAHR
jgi:protein-tyrosine phosphatase